MMDYGNATTRAIFWQFCTFIDQGKTQRRGEQIKKLESGSLWRGSDNDGVTLPVPVEKGPTNKFRNVCGNTLSFKMPGLI